MKVVTFINQKHGDIMAMLCHSEEIRITVRLLRACIFVHVLL